MTFQHMKAALNHPKYNFSIHSLLYNTWKHEIWRWKDWNSILL